MTAKRAFTVLLIAAGVVLAAEGILAAVTAVIWPVRPPAWQPRAFVIVWLAAVLLAVAAGVTYLLNRHREGTEADAP